MSYDLNPDILFDLGEAMAGGYLELPDGSPMRRWSRAVRRRFERRALPEYEGTRLYPCGLNRCGDENRIVGPSYSFTWSYNPDALEGCLATVNNEDARRTLEALQDQMSDLQLRLNAIRTVHTVGGRGYTHSIPNYGRVLREGLDTYADRVTKGLTCARRACDEDKIDFYASLLDVLAGIREWHRRLLETLVATRMESTEAEARRLALIACLRQVPFSPARTFAEAAVCYNVIYYLDDCDNPGRVDQELIGYYHRDVAEGLVTYGEAEGFIRELWLNTDANSGWSATIGGSTSGGQPAYNALTSICLRAAQGMRRPNLQLRVRRDMPDELWEEAFDTLKTGTGLPALHNEEGFLESIRQAHLGVREADLAMINGGGCTETMIHGCSNVGSLDAGINLPLILEESLRECLTQADEFEDVVNAYKQEVRAAIHTIVDQVSHDQQIKAMLRPQPMRSLLIDDCIENGVEYNAGGARYNWSVINVAGLANVVDSLSAVRDAVFEEADVSAEKLLASLAHDFEGEEGLRERLRACPCYGNGDERTDRLAAELAAFVFREFLGHAPWRGGKFLASCLMFVTYASAGTPVGATPDGRRSGSPIADSAGPMQGRDLNGPTALIRSVARLPHRLAPGTLVVNARFAGALFDTPEQRKNLKALIRTYFDLGGMQIQINVIDQALLREACEHPEEYPDLVVRVGGYSEYFSRLSPELRQSILERTEHSL